MSDARPLRLLVIEGNTSELRERRENGGRADPSAVYAGLLRSLAPGAQVDICFPAERGAALPDGAGLADYDGVAITGSGLHVYECIPAVTAQIDLVRAVFAAGTPCFGSCWGLQVGTVAAGGVVRRNPKGRELGISRRIRMTRRGRFHAMYVGKDDVFQAVTIHLDEVATLAAGSIVLATNDHSAVQATEFRCGPGVFWGVQYHPETDLDELAAALRVYQTQLPAEGFASDEADAERVVADFARLAANPDDKALRWRLGAEDSVLDPGLRTRELQNWIDYLVTPTRHARGRG